MYQLIPNTALSAIAGYMLGAACHPLESFEGSPQSYTITRCFVDAAGDFVQYEQQQYDDTACATPAAEPVNTSAPGCQSLDHLTKYACQDSSSSPWTELSAPALTTL
jgi:hypothetical protein